MNPIQRRRFFSGQKIKLAKKLFDAYKARVLSNSGITESDICNIDKLDNLDSRNLLQSATFVLAPSGYKSGVIYSQVPSNGNGDLTVTRATTATRVNSSGLIESVASGVPQLDYSLGGCPNFLFEPQRTNLVLRSEEFDNAYWGKYLATVSANTANSPDGSNNADLVYPSSTGALSGQLFRQITTGISTGNVVTVSAFVKASGKNFAYLSEIQNSFNPAAYFNLTTGAITNISAGVTASMIPLSNSWWRISITSTAGAGLYYAVIGSTDSAGITLNTASDTNGILVYGYQVEVGAYLTTYIPTTSAAVTRNTTNFTRSNIYTNGLIGASGGTWLVELKNNISYTRDASNLGIYISDAAVANAIAINNSTNTLLLVRKYVAASPTTIYTTDAAQVKLVVKWYNDGSNKVDVFANGLKVVTGSSLFDITQLSSLTSNNADVPKYISQMALWNTPLSEAQCISLSSYTTFEVAKQLLDKVIADAIADGGTYKQSNYNATIDRIVAAMNAFGTTDLSSRMVAWVDPEYLPYRQSTEAGTASLSGCRKLYDLFRRVDFSQTTPASMPLLLLHSGENYWWSGGTLSNYCSTPNAAANQITGDIDIIAKISLFTKNTVYTIISKYVLTEFAYMLRTNAAGGLQLSVSLNGSTNITTQSTSSTPFGVNEIGWVRATRISSTGVVTFYTSTDGITWTQLGNTVTNTSGSIYASSSIVEVGTYNNGGTDVLNGRVFRATISNSIGGTPVVDFNPQSFNPSSSQTQWTSATGEVWTINTPLNTLSANNNYKGALVYRNMIMADGIDDAMASGNVTIGGQKLGVYSSNRMLNNVSSLNFFLELSQNAGTTNDSFWLLNTNDSGSARVIEARFRSSSLTNKATSTTDVFTNRLALHSVTMDSSSVGNRVLLHYNSNNVSANYVNATTGSFATPYPLYLFARNGNTGLANMSLHDLMLVTDITKRTEMENIIRLMSSNFAF